MKCTIIKLVLWNCVHTISKKSKYQTERGNWGRGDGDRLRVNQSDRKSVNNLMFGSY